MLVGADRAIEEDEAWQDNECPGGETGEPNNWCTDLAVPYDFLSNRK